MFIVTHSAYNYVLLDPPESAKSVAQRFTLKWNSVNSCFFGKHIPVSALKFVALIGETPHPTSPLGHLLPKGKARSFAF